jgi:hypothetical protein
VMQGSTCSLCQTAALLAALLPKGLSQTAARTCCRCYLCSLQLPSKVQLGALLLPGVPAGGQQCCVHSLGYTQRCRVLAPDMQGQDCFGLVPTPITLA